MKAILIILIVLTVIALLPIGVDGGYRCGVFELNAKCGPFLLRILPKKNKAPKPKKPRKQKKRVPGVTEAETTGKRKKRFDKQQLIGIIKAGMKTLGRLKRKLSIDYLRIHCIFASDDPAKTAMGYGMASASVGAIIPLLDETFRIKERDIGFSFDFLAEKPAIDIWITATFKAWEIIYIAAAFGIDFLKLKRQKKRRIRVKERNELNGQTSNR